MRMSRYVYVCETACVRYRVPVAVSVDVSVCLPLRLSVSIPVSGYLLCHLASVHPPPPLLVIGQPGSRHGGSLAGCGAWKVAAATAQRATCLPSSATSQKFLICFSQGIGRTVCF